MATTKQLTPRQVQIKDLIDQGKDPGEIAKKLGTSAQAIYAQTSRMRAGGHLPAANSNGGKRRKARRNSLASRKGATAVAPTPAPKAPATVEEVLDAELGTVLARLEDIQANRAALDSEAERLTARQNVLAAMQQAAKVGAPA